MRRFAICAAVAVLTVMALLSMGRHNPAQAHPNQFREPFLTGASVIFHTQDDDKDWDTRLDLRLEANGCNIGSIENITGRFPDHTNNGPYHLRLFGRPGRHQVQHGVLHLHIQPNGRDQWRFNTTLRLQFSDGSYRPIEFGRIELSHNARHGTLSF